jgi:hypothetical protein
LAARTTRSTRRKIDDLETHSPVGATDTEAIEGYSGGIFSQRNRDDGTLS